MLAVCWDPRRQSPLEIGPNSTFPAGFLCVDQPFTCGSGRASGGGAGVSEASGVVPAFYTSLQILETKATPPLPRQVGSPWEGSTNPPLKTFAQSSPPPAPHPPLSSMGWEGASVDLQMLSHCPPRRALPGPAAFRLGLLPPLFTLKS